MLPYDFRHYHIPWWRRWERKMDDLSEKISDWSCQPVAFNMSRGELILAICGILALALLLHLNWDWVFGAH